MQLNPSLHWKSVVSLYPVSISTSTAGTGVDTLGFRYAYVTVAVGAIASTGTLTINVQESDTSGSGYTTLTGLTAALTDTGDNQELKFQVRLHGRERYLRVQAVAATAASLVSATIVLANAQYTDADASQTLTASI